MLNLKMFFISIFLVGTSSLVYGAGRSCTDSTSGEDVSIAYQCDQQAPGVFSGICIRPSEGETLDEDGNFIDPEATEENPSRANYLPNNYFQRCLRALVQKQEGSSNDDSMTNRELFQSFDMEGFVDGDDNRLSDVQLWDHVANTYANDIAAILFDLRADQEASMEDVPEDFERDPFEFCQDRELNTRENLFDFYSASTTASNMSALCSLFLAAKDLPDQALYRGTNGFVAQYDYTNLTQLDGEVKVVPEFSGYGIPIGINENYNPSGEPNYDDLPANTKVVYLPVQEQLIIDPAPENGRGVINNVAPQTIGYSNGDGNVQLNYETNNSQVVLRTLENLEGQDRSLEGNGFVVRYGPENEHKIRVRYADNERYVQGIANRNDEQLREIMVSITPAGQDYPISYIMSEGQYQNFSALMAGSLRTEDGDTTAGQELDLRLHRDHFELVGGRYQYNVASHVPDGEARDSLTRLVENINNGDIGEFRGTSRFNAFGTEDDLNTVAADVTDFISSLNEINDISDLDVDFVGEYTTELGTDNIVTERWENIRDQSFVLQRPSDEANVLEYIHFADEPRRCFTEEELEEAGVNREMRIYSQSEDGEMSSRVYDDFGSDCFFPITYHHRDIDNPEENKEIHLWLGPEMLENLLTLSEDDDDLFDDVQIQTLKIIDGEDTYHRIKSIRFDYDIPSDAVSRYIGRDPDFGAGEDQRISSLDGERSGVNSERRSIADDIDGLDVLNTSRLVDSIYFGRDQEAEDNDRNSGFVMNIYDETINSEGGLTRGSILRDGNERLDFFFDAERVPVLKDIASDITDLRLSDDGNQLVLVGSRDGEDFTLGLDISNADRYEEEDEESTARTVSRSTSLEDTRRDIVQRRLRGEDVDGEEISLAFEEDGRHYGTPDRSSSALDLSAANSLEEMVEICLNRISHLMSDGDIPPEVEEVLPEFLNIQASLTMHRLGIALLNTAENMDGERITSMEQVIQELVNRKRGREYDRLNEMMDSRSFRSRTEFANAVEMLMDELQDAQGVPEDSFKRIDNSDINMLNILAVVENEQDVRAGGLWLNNGEDESVLNMIKMLHSGYIQMHNARRINNASARLANINDAIDRIDSLERRYQELIGQISSKYCRELRSCTNNYRDLNSDIGGVDNLGRALSEAITAGLAGAGGSLSSSSDCLERGGETAGCTDGVRSISGREDREFVKQYLEKVKFGEIWLKVAE